MKISRFNRLLGSISIAFAGVIAPAICAADDPIDVGVILPLSGEVANVGTSVKNGILFAYEDLPTATKDRIRIHFEDDLFQPKNSVTAINRLIADKGIDVLINAGSSTGNALAPIAEAKHLPFFAIATDPGVSINRKYVFNIWVSVEAETDVVMAEVQKRGYTRIARIATIHDMMSAVKKSFDRRAKGSPEVAIDEEYAADVKDFRPFLSKLRGGKRPDAILTLLFPGQVGLFAKQAREMGIDVPLFTYEMFEDSAETKVSGGALVGQWYVNAVDGESDFLQRFRERFPGSLTFGAANGHDALGLIASAAEHGIEMRDLPDYLRSVRDFKGALGTFSAAPDNRFTLRAVAKIVTADGFAVLP